MAVGARARAALKLSSAAVDQVVGRSGRFGRDPDGIVVLIYHRVGATSGGEMNLAPEAFRDELDWLAETCRIVSLDTAVDELEAAGQAGSVRPGVVLTFDDGTADWADVVAPLLEARSVPATFYVTTGYAAGDLPLPDGEPAISWAGLADLAASGLATIGSHTHRHVLLDREPVQVVRDELDRSIDLLATHLGRAPTHFAYPKAVSPGVAALTEVRARFRSAVLSGSRPNRAGSDLHRLGRTPIQASDHPRWYQGKAQGGGWFEDSLRGTINRMRYRGATT
jgi:peptidoglycan/xylan/chitin deacetylase (PgdA/CDA1 family)